MKVREVFYQDRKENDRFREVVDMLKVTKTAFVCAAVREFLKRYEG